MKKKILIDVTIEADVPQPYYTQHTMAALADYYELWVKEFHEFINDHRSQDAVTLTVNREYQDQCEYCESVWEDVPACCDEAIKEYDEAMKAQPTTEKE